MPIEMEIISGKLILYFGGITARGICCMFDDTQLQSCQQKLEKLPIKIPSTLCFIRCEFIKLQQPGFD